MDTTFESFRQHFLEVYRKISHLNKDDILFKPIQEYLPFFEALMKFGNQQPQVAQSLESHAQKVPQVEDTFKKVSQLVYYFNLRCEIDAAENIIRSTDPINTLKKFPLYESYLKIIQAEVAGAKLIPGHKVIFLGSGPFPVSLILFSLLYGIEGVGIEREDLAASISSKLIGKLELQEKIKIFRGDHNSFNFNNKFDHLIIALDAEPKNEIFECILRSRGTTSVSYRISRITKHLFDLEKGREVVSSSLVPYLTFPVEPPGVGNVVFLRKQAI